MSNPFFFTPEVRAEFDPRQVRELTPLVRRITANNPGMMTGPGTNCYLVGRKEVAVIDTGKDDPAHIERIAEAGQGRIRWILITHTHPDHHPGSKRLSELTGAPVLAHPGRLKTGGDESFQADGTLNDGDRIEGADVTLRCLHTPGHASNHLCFLLEQERMLFAGDQVMDGSTVVIAPPDGDMQAYLDALRRLMTEPVDIIAPAHGRLLPNARQVLQSIIDHRLAREDKVLKALSEGAKTLPDIVAHAYQDVPKFLHKVAEFSVHAHLLKLQSEGRAAEKAVGEWGPARPPSP